MLTDSPLNWWLAGFDANRPARFRVFCLPCAGRGAAQFARWRSLLPPDIQLCPIQLPGREVRIADPPAEDVIELTGRLLRALAPLLDVPFAVFGHSMGALIGFELARGLRSNFGIEPAALFVAARPAPSVMPSDQFDTTATDRRQLDTLWGKDSGSDEWRAARSLATEVLLADEKMCANYIFEPSAPLGCPITAIRGMADTAVTDDLMAPWAKETSGPFSLRRVAGDHFLDDSWTELPELIANQLGNCHG